MPDPDRLRSYGRLAGGREVHAVRLSWPDGIEVEVLDYGCIVSSLRVPTAAGSVETVSSYPNLAGYEADKAYHGAIVGRFANRVAQARFAIDGLPYEVTANEGDTCLHGGRLGLTKRLWRFEQAQARTTTLAYDSPDGEEGFPGRLACRVRLTLVTADALEIVWEARTDRPTPVNLTHHLYFNLSGDAAKTILDHELTIAADQITPVNDRLIPTGGRMEVQGTPFDFGQPRTLRSGLKADHPQLQPGGGYDHNFVLSGAEPAVRLRSPESGLSLEITTDQPGLQLYGGQGMAEPFVRYGAMALEPQGFPDSVNQPSFPDPVLRPGQLYRRWALYRFSAGPPG